MSLFHSLYNMPGLAPRIYVLFLWRCIFEQFNKTSLTAIRRITLEILYKEVLWSIRWSYQTIWSFPLVNLKWHFVAWPYTMTSLNRSVFIPNHDLITELDLLPNNEMLPENMCDECGMPKGDASGCLVPSHLGLTYVPVVWTNPFPDLVVIFSEYALRTSLGTFSILLKVCARLCNENPNASTRPSKSN